MKKLFLYTAFLLSLNTLAQGEANNWYFGQHAGLDFNGNEPTSITGALNTNEGCASFSDKNGNLLFYTDGINVWNRNHGLMPNGRDLLGNPSSTQSGIIVPHPGNPNQFFIFTVGSNYDDGVPGLKSYIVDMTADNGFGDVISNYTDLSGPLSDEWTEKVTSVKGGDCSTYWIISLVNNAYYAFKVDKSGLHPTPKVSYVSHMSNDRRGYLKVSPDGTKLANANYNTRQGEVGEGKCILYSFNDMTGEVVNDGIELISNTANDGEPYGVEFSPLSSKLYVSTFDAVQYYKLFQFDLEETNIINSKTQIHRESGYRGGLQLAPDGKIYVTIPYSYDDGTSYLDVINFPDKKGSGCDFETNAINLGSGRAMQGLPPFISSILLPIEIKDSYSTTNINKTTVKRCEGDNYTMSSELILGDPQFKWTFKDSIISTQKTLEILNLSTESEGIYYLEVETIDECDFRISYKGEVTLEVYPPPQISAIEDIIRCDEDGDGFFEIDLHSLKTAEVLNGQSDSEFEVLFFSSEQDAIDLENAIASPYTNQIPNSTEILYARIHNIENPICYELEPFSYLVYEKPNPPDMITDLVTCDSNTVGSDVDGLESFNLLDNTPEILNGQKPGDFNIFYYTDASYSAKIPNPSSFKNTTAFNQTIYVQIVNSKNSECEVFTSFNIEVFNLPNVNGTFTLKQCDEDGVSDGIGNFNLNEANEYLTLGDSSLNVEYYLNQTDAINGTNVLDPAPFSNATSSKVYAKIINSNGCYRLSELSLLVSATSISNTFVHQITYCDDDDIIDGLSFFDLKEALPVVLGQIPSGQNLEVNFYRNFEDAQLELNSIPIDTPYYSEVPFKQELFVRIESKDNGACIGIGPYVELNVNKRPVFDLDPEGIFCQNLPPIVLSAFNPEDAYSYIWLDENGTTVSTEISATISKEGAYTVIATSIDGCESFPKTVLIKPSIIADITLDDVTVTDDSENNTITIHPENLGIGEYEYTLNEPTGIYQDEPYFDGLLPGIHTLFVRDKNGCGISPLEISILGFPKFLTPNNDGYNDNWVVLGLSEQFYQSAKIHIFDRFGKVIATFDLLSEGWDGTFNGNKVPASDYWFTTELIDQKGNLRFKKGHFSLIRR